MRSSRFFILGATLLGLAALAAVNTLAGEKGKGKMKAGDKAPAFESIDDQGKPFKSTDVVGKKVVVLFFYPAALTGG